MQHLGASGDLAELARRDPSTGGVNWHTRTNEQSGGSGDAWSNTTPGPSQEQLGNPEGCAGGTGDSARDKQEPSGCGAVDPGCCISPLHRLGMHFPCLLYTRAGLGDSLEPAAPGLLSLGLSPLPRAPCVPTAFPRGSLLSCCQCAGTGRCTLILALPSGKVETLGFQGTN